MLIRRTIGPSTTHRGTVTEVIGPESHSWGNDPDNVNTTVFGGPTPHVLRKLSPETQKWGVDANNVNTTVFPPSSGDFVTSAAGRPSPMQLLGIDSMSTLTGSWSARTQRVESHGTILTSISRARGTMANNETIDMRGTLVYWCAKNPRGFAANFAGVHTPADSSCSSTPAVVGSYARNSSDFTSKANVGKVWGLDHVSGSNSPIPAYNTGATYPVGKWPKSWQEYKAVSGGPYSGLTVDGVSDPFDVQVAYIDCKPGAWTDFKNWCYVDGVWFRDPMDGVSTNGSPLYVGNCFIQFGHDDAHWMAAVANTCPPVYSFKNFYWNQYQGLSYKECSNPPAAGGDFSVYDGTVLAFTRYLDYENSSAAGGTGYPQDNYDAHGHAAPMAWRGPTNRPKLKFINTTILMLGQPAQVGLPQICVPTGSTASNSHLIYYDMGHDSGDHPPHPGETMWQGTASQSFYSMPGMSVHVVSGTDMNRGVCTTSGHSDHPVQDFFWPAVNRWISEHPQYGLRQMTGDWSTDYNYLNSYS